MRMQRRALGLMLIAFLVVCAANESTLDANTDKTVNERDNARLNDCVDGLSAIIARKAEMLKTSGVSNIKELGSANLDASQIKLVTKFQADVKRMGNKIMTSRMQHRSEASQSLARDDVEVVELGEEPTDKSLGGAQAPASGEDQQENKPAAGEDQQENKPTDESPGRKEAPAGGEDQQEKMSTPGGGLPGDQPPTAGEERDKQMVENKQMVDQKTEEETEGEKGYGIMSPEEEADKLTDQKPQEPPLNQHLQGHMEELISKCLQNVASVTAQVSSLLVQQNEAAANFQQNQAVGPADPPPVQPKTPGAGKSPDKETDDNQNEMTSNEEDDEKTDDNQNDHENDQNEMKSNEKDEESVP